LRSSDQEVAKRAAEILDYYDRRPMRELDAALKEGRVENVIELLRHWPNGKYEENAWHTACDLARILVKLHEEQGGQKIKDVGELYASRSPLVLNEKRVTENTKTKFDRYYFVRAEEVDHDRRRLKRGDIKNELQDRMLLVATGNVRIFTVGGGTRHVIFARGSVELIDRDGGVSHILIVSGGDVVLNGALWNSIVIARGKVTCTDILGDSRIISGKSVSTVQRAQNCIITENESNPLSFIRWADAPKEKAVLPKEK
jgi:predicted RNA-binding protein